MFVTAREAKADEEKFSSILEIVKPLYHDQMTLEQAHARVNQLKLNEVPIKKRIKEILLDVSYAPFYTPEKGEKLQKYSISDFKYFDQSHFLDSEMEQFNEAIHLYQGIVFERSFAVKKELLEWQVERLSV